MRPAYLSNGDKVAIVATAKKINPGEIDGAINLIKSWGLDVELGPNLYAADRQFAGNDVRRAADLQWALNDPEIKAVIFTRGGYGTVRIVDDIDWSAFIKQPKWLCGFSDLTVLHSHVHQNLGIETLHSSMPIFWKDGRENESNQTLRKALFGECAAFQWGWHDLNRNGEAQGEVIGGNLSVLYSIAGSISAMDFTGKILFIEDLTEYLYHLDRMMMQFKRSGQLANLAGLIVGQFSDMIDNPVPFGRTPEEIIFEAVAEFDFPVSFNAPIGHVDDNWAIYHGRSAKLDVEGGDVLLDFNS